MTSDYLVLLGGALGALAHRLINPDKPNWSLATLGEILVAAASMLVLVGSGLIPKELQDAMFANPIRTVAFTFLASALMGAGVVTLGKATLYRILDLPSNGDGNGGKFGAGRP